MKVGSSTVGSPDTAARPARRRRQAAADMTIGTASAADFRSADVLRPHRLEVALYALCIFLLSSPFTFFLTGQDPRIGEMRSIGTMHSETAQTLMYVVRALALVIAGLGILPRRRMAVRNLRSLWPIAPFTAWITLSIFWSDNMSSTWHNVAVWIVLALAAYCVGQRLSPGHLARATIGAGVLAAVFSIAFVLLLPAYGMHQANDAAQSVHAGAWRGIYIHKNYFGHVMAFFAIVTIWVSRRTIPRPWMKWTLVGLFLTLDVLSTSAAALAMVVIASVIIWVVVVAQGTTQLRALFALGPALIIGYYVTGEIFALLHRDKSFSGRDIVWDYAQEAFLHRPLHGWGYVSMTYGDFSYLLNRATQLSDPHSGYWDLLLGTGIIGLGLFLLMVVMAARAARSLYQAGGYHREAGVALFALLAAFLVSCVTEVSDRPLGATAGFGLFALVCLLSAQRRQQLAPRP